ncbi:MAG: ABC transporter permease [Bacteroidota bacterium]
MKEILKDWLFLLGREFAHFWRYNIIKIIFLGAPLIYGILFGYVYQKGKVTDLPIVLVDQDHSPTSAKVIDMLDESEVINVVKIKDQEIDLKKEMLDNEADAIVIIPENFEADILQKRMPEINVKMNTANILTANFSSKALQMVFGTLNAGIEIEALKKQGINQEIASHLYEPFKVNYIKYYNKSSNYMYFLWPGMLGTILQQVLLIALALSFAREFEHRTFFKNFYPKTHNLLAAILIKCIPYWVLSSLVWASFVGMFYFFKLPIPENMVAINLLGMLFIVAVTFLGVLISVALPTQLSATDVLMIVATPSFVISGFTWPLSQMPTFVQNIANCIPLTHFLNGFRKAYMLNASLADVQPQINALLIMIGVFLTLALSLLYTKVYILRNAKI